MNFSREVFMEERKIILLHDIIETKVRKEKELEYYQRQLEELQRKMFFLNKEIQLTNTIIDIVEAERVLDIREHLIEKNRLQTD
jgi:hypothetical protein